MKKKTIVHFETLGCKLNQIESESASQSFIDSGFGVDVTSITSSTPINNDIFLCIINTCTVTSKAEQKARRLIRLLLEKCPNATILITGCYAEVESIFLQSIDSRIAVLKGTAKDAIVDLPTFIKIENLQNETTLNCTTRIRDFCNGITLKKANFKLSTDSFHKHTRASIKIQDGCNNNCAYCRIHIARGESVSLSVKTVIDRVKLLEANGQHEVILTGVNLSQYKSEYNDVLFDFADLLRILLKETSTIAFRISSLYPERVDEALCKILVSQRIRPHFHLSVQSGSDSILFAMHRPYKALQVIEAAKRLREIKPNCFLACDIITGFPGETDDDFIKTKELCKQCDFTWIHCFPFSPRPGTEAFSMKKQIPQSIAGQRVTELTLFAVEQKKKYLSKLIGTRATAIIEKRKRLPLRAVTENFIHIELEKVDIQGGTQVKIEFTGVKALGSQTESVEATAKIIEN